MQIAIITEIGGEAELDKLLVVILKIRFQFPRANANEISPRFPIAQKAI